MSRTVHPIDFTRGGCVAATRCCNLVQYGHVTRSELIHLINYRTARASRGQGLYAPRTDTALVDTKTHSSVKSNTFNKVAQCLICKLRGPRIKWGNGSPVIRGGRGQSLVIESVHQLLLTGVVRS